MLGRMIRNGLSEKMLFHQKSEWCKRAAQLRRGSAFKVVGGVHKELGDVTL